MKPLFELDSVASKVASWDANADARFLELKERRDSSYLDIEVLIVDYLAKRLSTGASVLDVGSGLGFVAKKLFDQGYDVYATDPSKRSIQIAKSYFPDLAERLFDLTMDAFASDARGRVFEAIVCNMVLHSVDDLFTFFASAKTVLARTGFVLAIVPNPDSYLQTRADVDVSNLDLTVSQVIPGLSFRIRGMTPHPELVTFYHRPFRDYSAIADVSGLRITDYFTPIQIGRGRSSDLSVMVLTALSD